jgi:hypothetical protein
VVEEDDDDDSGEESFVDGEQDRSQDEQDDDIVEDEEDFEDDDSEEVDFVEEVINVNSTDNWADEYKKRKKQNKYFTIGYHEFMWAKFEEVNKCEYYLCFFAALNFVYFIDQSDLSLDFCC